MKKNKKNLFGFSRKKWLQIIDGVEEAIFDSIIGITFGALPIICLLMAWFGM